MHDDIDIPRCLSYSEMKAGSIACSIIANVVKVKP